MKKYVLYALLAATIGFSATSCVTRPPHRHPPVVVDGPGHGKHHKKPKPPKKPKKPKKHTPPPPTPPHRR